MLANVYLDLGTWVGFTPYVGAGVGVTYLRSRDYDDTALPLNHAMAQRPGRISPGPRWPASPIRSTPSWVIDVGYRYLELGDLPTTTGTGLAIDNTTWKRLSTQEVRIGFRFLLD